MEEETKPEPLLLDEKDVNLSEPKLEEPDYYNYPMSESGSEALFEYPEYHKMEAKLDESEDSEYTKSMSMRNSVKLEDIVCSAEDLSVSKLDEPDFEYPEYLKLEPIESENNIGPIRKQSASSIQKQCYRRCSICRESVYLDELNYITTKERKLILLLGSVLKGTKTMEEAHFYISGWIYTCTVHLKDAVFEIFKVLNIKSLDEFVPHGNKNMQVSITKLLDIVKLMSPGFSFSQFRNALIATATMFTSKSLTVKVSNARQECWCLLCHQFQNPLTDIVSKANKLVLFVGVIFGRKKTMKEARLLLNNPSFFCCQSHVSEAGHKILEVLNIKSIDEWYLCSKYKLAEVMNIVWKLCSEISIAQFKIHLTVFLRMIPITIGNLWGDIEGSNVKVELLDHDYCIRNPVKHEEIDYSSEDLLESKLEETDDFEYPEYLKLESIETEHDIGPIRKHGTSSIQKQCYGKCSLCREVVCLDKLHWITSKDIKLILMLGLVLKETKPIEEAQLFISGKGIYTCTVHLKDAVFEIFNVLNIKSLKQFVPWNNKNMQISIEKLLDILKVMCPRFSFYQFRKALIATVKMFINESLTIKASNAGQKRWCMVCRQLENIRGFTDIVAKNSKLILFVGLIFGRKKTIREAKLLITYPTFFCCRSHLSEAGHKILEVLNIRRIDELHSCAIGTLEVMNIVWKLSPEYTVSQFKIQLFSFLRTFSIGN